MVDSLWLVIGGEQLGGILVRSGQDVSSVASPERLSYGAIVRQLSVQGERLQYKLLKGHGPSAGWVTTKTKGKELLIRQDRVWQVVGGINRGGIVVREGADVTSAELSDRLSTGALVKEICYTSETFRLHYERITGSGPSSGWVSTKLRDSTLVAKWTVNIETRYSSDGANNESTIVPSGDGVVVDIGCFKGRKGEMKGVGKGKNKNKPSITKAPSIAKDDAMLLQGELYEAFACAEFQEKLLDLQAQYPTQDAEFVAARQQLFLSVQRAILPEYGFSGTMSGVLQMMASMRPFINDPDFVELASATNALMGVDLPSDTWDDFTQALDRGRKPKRAQFEAESKYARDSLVSTERRAQFHYFLP